ncbi:porin [Burkholderia sp. Ac-20345]|uniref:porin n=1 Tax=Burkholderia sp. Ac-20345 TaxID=2703891 RepID=UPI00197B1198|nr:porin [Burkholderia sp. Ac-20345]MBN3778632.1 porin [Burkholderia sp. Ac-20345]
MKACLFDLACHGGRGGAIAVAAMLACGSSYAQSNVALYGVIDTGITYVNNQQQSVAGGVAGKQAWSMTSGNVAPTTLGFKGTESLGGGYNAVFDLRNYFLSNNGALFEQNALFDATAIVGIQSDRWGTLTLGRQFDSYTDALGPFAVSNTWAGPAGAHFGDIDNLNAAFNVNNAVKYLSPSFSGLSFGGTFSFGNQAGAFATNRAWALAINYSNGPFSAAAGYLSMRNPLTAGLRGEAAYIGELSCGQSPSSYCGMHDSDELRTFGAGASYAFDKLTLSATVTQAKLLGSRYLTAIAGPVSDIRFDTAEASALYNVTPALQAGIAYSYTLAKISATDSRTDIHKVSVAGIYSLSKRTALYTTVNYEKMAGDGLGIDPLTGVMRNYAQLAYVGSANASSQVAVSVGIKHTF